MAAERYSQQYTFTVTLLPRQHDVPAEEQYDRTSGELERLLTTAGKITLVAETTKNFDIHYHGTIQMKLSYVRQRNILKLFKDMFRGSRLFGYVDIKVCTNEPGWIEYITKGLKEFKDTVGRLPVIVDSLNQVPTGQFQLYGITEV